MSKCNSLWVVVLVLLALAAGSAQETPAQAPPQEPPAAAPQQPTPPDNQPSAPQSISENPPISGVDLPNLEPHAAPLSYLQPGAHVSESVDSNIENALGGSSTNSISRAEGSLELRRLWSNYDLALDYLGGVGYYNAAGIGLKQVQELGLDQKITWKRGQLNVRDAFSYQPEGTFGGSYGSVGATGAGLTGISSFFPGALLGSLGQVPRILNIAMGDVVEAVTPKSSITVTGAYGFVHFLGDDQVTGNAFLGSTEETGQIGYDRILGPHDQAAVVYGYQGFQFSTGVNFHSSLVQFMWGHRISGRMDFLIGAGPQVTQINDLLTPATLEQDLNPPSNCTFVNTGGLNFQLYCPTNDRRISAAGRVSLRYQFPKVNLTALYQHYITNGAGLFLGATSDVVRLTASRPLGRIWSISTDIGYSRNSRVVPTTCVQSASTPNCPGVSADIYSYGFAGVAFHRMFGRNFHGYASYQFNDLAFDSSYCTSGVPCNRTSQRNVGTIGLDWIPRPIRLD